MELISREGVIKALQKWNCRDSISLTINPYEVLRDIPTIEERKEGHWIKHFDDMFPGDSTIECSVCHEEQYTTIDDYFCPNCGARMKGE